MDYYIDLKNIAAEELKHVDLDRVNVNCSPPDFEPARQYYFMAKCRKAVRDFEQSNGRFPTACVQTFGCQMNARDSEKLIGILEAVGYIPVDTEEADLVLYNTCTVRENANLKVYGRLGRLGTIKRKNKNMVIGLCGCMMQEPDVVDKIKKSYGFVDIIFGTHNIFKLAELLAGRLESGGMIADIQDSAGGIVEELPSDRKYSFKQGVNITFGCDNYCSYCIVPYVRGRERSRAPEDIISEIKMLAFDGVSEVMLLGQNVNSYGRGLDTPVTFAKLLTEIEKIDGIERIRFMTPHPKDLSDELIEVMKNSTKICNHIHLPLQSGSSRILKLMNRRYTKEHYLELIEKLRENMPDVAITTDIIVGFPGETEEDFLETMDVVNRAEYDNAYTFIYSKRTGTPAASMPGEVPYDVVRNRFDRLTARIAELSAENINKYVNTVQKVLVESVSSHDASLVTGRMTNNTLVHFPGDEELIGRIIDVKIVSGRGFYCFGEPAQSATA